MGILKAFFNNTRKPKGLLGRCMVGSMNHAHAALADWGLSHLPETGPTEIAELGCGGGRNIRALLRKYPAATVTALDYSEISVEKAKSVNRKGLQASRCRIIQGDVSCLPFEDGAFDLVTAFETVYFWPGPTESFREVYRTLRPGGIFVQVLAGQGHLPGLKSIIYPAHVEKEKMLHPALPGFGLLHTQTLRFSFSLPDAQSVHDLLYMTPHVWRITKRGAEALAQTAQLTDTAEVIFNIYGRQEAGNLLE